MTKFKILLFTVAMCCGGFTSHAFAKIEFNRDIRPIFSDTCFQCHGPDEKQRKSNLRLDVRAEALKPAKSGAIAIVPGKPEKSEIIARVFTDSEEDLMPPTKLHKPLTKQQQELLKQWVAEGAEYQGHWAFIAPTTPVIPQIQNPKFKIQNPIDAFILARLQKEGLQPMPETDRATLIRRVSLDLVGLPPSPEEVDAFLNDNTPNAYEKVVDRLLASKHYGEQMARQWLDFARYADSHGFQTDSSREMWPWRDWVIKAFNENLPYDQFTIQQIAGDLLPNATRDQIVATGFNRNHRLNGEGGSITEEWRIENIIDRVETMSFTWLGLSMNCCRCHDHKYDPFTQRDFYSLFAFFNNVPESGMIQAGSNRSGGNTPPVIDVPTVEQEAKLVKLNSDVKVAEQHVMEAAKLLPKLLTEWETKAMAQMVVEKTAWDVIAPVSVKSQGGATLTKQSDGSYLASGTNPDSDAYVITAKMPGAEVSAFLLECFPDASLPNQSLGRASNGNFVLAEFEVDVMSTENGGNPVQAKIGKAQADYSQKGYEITNLVTGGKKRQKGKGWAVDGPTKKEPRKAMFVLDKPAPAGATVTITLKHDAIGGHNIGRFRLSASTLPAKMVNLDGKSDLAAMHAILKIPANKRSAQQKTEVEKYFRTAVDSPVRGADAELAKSRKALEDFEKMLPTVMVMKENDKPRDAFILKRGEYDKPGDKVSMATPAVLPAMPQGAPLNRLGLARWMVDTKNPLTARVWVNRAWEKFFGNGICKSTENLGSQAEWPSHPELLDWLATEFMRMKWDMKAFQKMLVMSSTYRQSSKITKELFERDPENRLLARGPRFRLGGEAVRDQALVISGLLAPTIGGPSVRPYMPEGVWDETSKYGDLRGYKADTGDSLYRRSLYTFWKRTAAPPSMLLFDAPSREICTVKRSRTNTPLQALSLLNEVTFVEASRGLAQQMMKHS
ncbi:MAG: PSD1 and planctomycete cytochrome C domain-containing protein, partial [Verrucomicrobia bacterium]|nr:PSD1 and planctomycete cytochrome C domain-containing protein [Verrucomicrobiota bacterium]